MPNATSHQRIEHPPSTSLNATDHLQASSVTDNHRPPSVLKTPPPPPVAFP
uniref:Uncharacterized protein n=1 Tax=Cucumis melo TaxID=3656 RepID=A0A9I9D9T5_CUCME